MCRNEIETINKTSSANNGHNVVNLSTFKQETKIDEIKKNAFLKKQKHSDDQTNIMDRFTIDSTSIYKLPVNNNLTIYSFRIYHKFQDPRNIYNLIYRKTDNSLDFSIIHITADKIYSLYDSKEKPHNKPHARTSNEDCEASYTLWACKNDASWAECDKCGDCLTTVCVGSGSGGDIGGGYNGGYYDPKTGGQYPAEGGANQYQYTDPSGYIFDPNLPPSIDDEYIRASRAYSFWMQLDGNDKMWVYSGNQGIYNLILENYLNKYSTTNNTNNLSFANWSIDFFIQNSNTTPEQFQNWFMGESEGQDGTYDASYWDNPNLTFPAQNLPSWNAYYNAYPHHSDGSGMTADEVYTLVGGVMKQNHFSTNPVIAKQWENACAIRVSRALNYSGVTIPAVPGTFKGDDGKNYFVSAKTLNSWMRKTFGVAPSNPNHLHITSQMVGVSGANLPNLLLDKNLSTATNKVYVKGIYSLISSNSAWASGHADCLQDNGKCINYCHFDDAPIDYIDIWILK